MRMLTLTALLAAALLGCDQVDTDGTMPVDSTTPDTAAPADSTTPRTGGDPGPTVAPGPTDTPSTPPAPDNTGINERDANRGATKTPTDQGSSEADTKMTAEIRQRIVDTPDMSINARNVKIITASGKVTLRGPVSTEPERDTIVKIARDVAGEGNVDNQLELAKESP
jgi:hyperosmotically inducible protein